ncbi:type II toxin-antitoxin system HicA family toxin [Falsochrobactrum shanghaiense]|nr:type II toxin-antitoxin system HicA family toxin [Falsochrobactrum shanghaiense]
MAFSIKKSRPKAAGCANMKSAIKRSAMLSYYACISAKVVYIASMNSKQKKTLAAIFKDPVSGTIEWAAVESLLLAVGCQVIEGNGSRVRFEINGEIESFHRPHPAKEAKRYQVRAARAFLIRLGVEP